MQPANTSKEQMFGTEAPVWSFLNRFGGPTDPLALIGDTWVFETYPVLAIIALLWTLPDSHAAGRLPKYNPERKKTFSILDWQHVCGLALNAFRERGLIEVVQWIDDAAQTPWPRKSDQDSLDACLCLLVALFLAEHVRGAERRGHFGAPPFRPSFPLAPSSQIGPRRQGFATPRPTTARP
jgi:predicted RNase H-like nuclease